MIPIGIRVYNTDFTHLLSIPYEAWLSNPGLVITDLIICPDRYSEEQLTTSLGVNKLKEVDLSLAPLIKLQNYYNGIFYKMPYLLLEDNKVTQYELSQLFDKKTDLYVFASAPEFFIDNATILKKVLPIKCILAPAFTPRSTNTDIRLIETIRKSALANYKIYPLLRANIMSCSSSEMEKWFSKVLDLSDGVYFTSYSSLLNEYPKIAIPKSTPKNKVTEYPKMIILKNPVSLRETPSLGATINGIIDGKVTIQNILRSNNIIYGILKKNDRIQYIILCSGNNVWNTTEPL